MLSYILYIYVYEYSLFFKPNYLQVVIIHTVFELWIENYIKNILFVKKKKQTNKYRLKVIQNHELHTS